MAHTYSKCRNIASVNFYAVPVLCDDSTRMAFGLPTNFKGEAIPISSYMNCTHNINYVADIVNVLYVK